MQGSLEELAAEGNGALVVATSDDERALGILSLHHAVGAAREGPEGIHIELAQDVEPQPAADDIGRRLVMSGLAIRRFEPGRASLEQRFLEITSRLEEAA